MSNLKFAICLQRKFHTIFQIQSHLIEDPSSLFELLLILPSSRINFLLLSINFHLTEKHLLQIKTLRIAENKGQPSKAIQNPNDYIDIRRLEE